MYPLLKISIDCRYINITIKVKYRFITGQVLLSNKPIPYFKGCIFKKGILKRIILT